MYISRVEIDRKNRQKIRDLSHLGAYHNWVESSFSRESEERNYDRKLWRIDELGEKKYLIIISNDKPILKALEKYGVDGSAECKLYDEFLDKLYEGQTLRFKVTLTPVISKSTGKKSGKRGKNVSIIGIDGQFKYLMDRALKNGFSLKYEDYYITNSDSLVLKKKGRNDFYVNTVSYEGKLQITDIEKFRKVLTKGLGKKKAYGCGMMTVIVV